MVYYDLHTHHLPTHSEDIVIINRMVGNGGWPISNLGTIYYSAGIHPWYINAKEKQLAEFEDLLLCSDVVAVGEVGLDKYAKVSLIEQRLIFERSILLAEKKELPLIIHCVKAWNELIDLKKVLKPRMPWIIHGFRGNEQLAKQLIQQGFFLSFGNYFNPKAVFEAWPNHLFVETDDQQIDIRVVYKNISSVLNLPLKLVVFQVAEKVHRVLQLR